jgi:transketolase
MAYFGYFIPYGATFMVFSDYMRPSVRVSALSHLQTVWVWTHDSVFVGEDGPTHQPIEHLASLRAMPNLRLIRPADAAETAVAWAAAILSKDRPTALALSRQKAPAVERASAKDALGLLRGAYVVSDPEGGDPEAIVIATGTEVKPAQDAVRILAAEGRRLRLVSMPCWELFEEQDEEYRESVLPSSVTRRIAVEAGSSFGWERYVLRDGLVIGVDRFGASAPLKDLQENFGFTADRIAGRIRDYLG